MVNGEGKKKEVNHVLESSMMGRAGDTVDHGREQGCQVLQPIITVKGAGILGESNYLPWALGARCWSILPLTSVLFKTSPHHSELLGKQHPQKESQDSFTAEIKGTVMEEGV